MTSNDNDTLDNWRQQIDSIDDHIITLLAQRTVVVKKIGKYKQEHNIPFKDKKRFQTLLQNLSNKAEKLNLPTAVIEDIYKIIHDHSLSVQK